MTKCVQTEGVDGAPGRLGLRACRAGGRGEQENAEGGNSDEGAA